ncbi:hypothetical protein ACFHWD_04420 [Clostridium sp. MT-14]|uniref:hypothetical protein n=1 Tax=Clostridium sp. MT-14 TaxID=3348360 RepID=UPI0035F28F7F
MTLKEYIKIIVITIPIFLGMIIGAIIISHFVHSELQGWIISTIFAIIYCFPMIKYIEKMANKFNI